MSNRRIEDLDIRFQPLIRTLLSESNKLTSPWTTFTTDGFRTFAEQANLYASGRTKEGKILTNAKPGTSNHEKGLAVDIAFQNGGKLSYDKGLYGKIVPIAKSLGIAWGGDWKDFPDVPHFEKLNFPKPTTQPVVVPPVTPPSAPEPVKPPETSILLPPEPNVVPVPSKESLLSQLITWLIGLLNKLK